MDEAPLQQTWRREAQALCEIGKGLVDADLPNVEVRIARPLAEQAVRAWEREEGSELPPETDEQQTQRSRAGTLALIGLRITERGQWMADEVLVPLNPVFIGIAVDAAWDSSSSRNRA